MTRDEFLKMSFYKGQKFKIVETEEVKILEKVDTINGILWLSSAGWVGTSKIKDVVLVSPDPLAILREIMRRMNSATGEPTACRLDPDLMEQVKKLFEDEQV